MPDEKYSPCLSDQDGPSAGTLNSALPESGRGQRASFHALFTSPRSCHETAGEKVFCTSTHFPPLSLYTWKGETKTSLVSAEKCWERNGLSTKLQSCQMLKIKNASYRRVNQRYAKLNTNLSLNRVSQLPPEYNLCSGMGMKSCVSRAVGAFVCFLKCLVKQQCRAVKIGLFLCALWVWLLTEKARGLCESVLVPFCTRLSCVWSPRLCKWCLWPHEPLVLPQTSFCSGTVTATTGLMWWPPAPTC